MTEGWAPVRGEAIISVKAPQSLQLKAWLVGFGPVPFQPVTVFGGGKRQENVSPQLFYAASHGAVISSPPLSDQRALSAFGRIPTAIYVPSSLLNDKPYKRLLF